MSVAGSPLRIYRALDLAALADKGELWRGLRAASVVVEGGTVTPLGFWFGEGDGAVVPGERWLEVGPIGAARAIEPPGRGDRRVPEVRLGSEALRGGLALEVGANGARVGVRPSEWPRAEEAVLLVVSQCWRFFEVERRLDGLSAGLDAKGAAGSLRGLLIDLPEFEGPLIDPRGYFGTREGASLYRGLARRMGLSAWRERVWERAEVVEAAVESLVEERRHVSAMAWPLVLEALILVAIVADLGWSVVSAWVTE